MEEFPEDRPQAAETQKPLKQKRRLHTEAKKSKNWANQNLEGTPKKIGKLNGTTQQKAHHRKPIFRQLEALLALQQEQETRQHRGGTPEEERHTSM